MGCSALLFRLRRYVGLYCFCQRSAFALNCAIARYIRRALPVSRLRVRVPTRSYLALPHFVSVGANADLDCWCFLFCLF